MAPVADDAGHRFEVPLGRGVGRGQDQSGGPVVQGRGIGRQLKKRLSNLAQADGIRLINSQVHSENTDMLKLNRSLDAVVIPDPDEADGKNFICTIEVAESSSRF